MAKLKIVANPTFTADVPIPVAGGESVPVKFEFRHRTKSDLDAWIKARVDKTDLDSFLDMVVAWPGFEEEFNRENVETMLENYAGAGLETFKVYIDQLVQARTKN